MAATAPEISRLKLERPIELNSQKKAKRRSSIFWKDLGRSAAVLAGAVVIFYLWDLWKLPSFEFNGDEHSWFFPVYTVAALYSVRTAIGAFTDERKRRSDASRRDLEAAFGREIFPFLRGEIAKQEEPMARKLGLPPTDWLIAKMTDGSTDGATWSSRVKDTDDFAHLSARLEAQNSEVVFAIERPSGV